MSDTCSAASSGPRPTIALVLILITTGSLLAFDQFFILTNGGPDISTTSIVMVIFREAFTRFDLGSAAAISVILLLASLSRIARLRAEIVAIGNTARPDAPDEMA